MTEIKRLQSMELYRHCDPEQFDFETTADLEALKQIVGQPRAVEAMRFGMGIGQEGYNIFALGPPGTGKQSVIRRFFERWAESEPVPDDWCYVNNFEESHKPRAIRLPAGKGGDFRDRMEHLVEQLHTAISSAFESEEYQTRRQAIQEEFQEQQSQALEEIQKRAQEESVALIRTPVGFAAAPVRDGEVLPRRDPEPAGGRAGASPGKGLGAAGATAQSPEAGAQPAAGDAGADEEAGPRGGQVRCQWPYRRVTRRVH